MTTTIYCKRSSIEPDEDVSLLTSWVKSTEAAARADVGWLYSQRPDGNIVEALIATMKSTSSSIAGKKYCWRIGIPEAEPVVPRWLMTPVTGWSPSNSVTTVEPNQTTISKEKP